MKHFLIALAVLSSACGGSPIAPARVRSRSTVTFDSTQLGHATVISTDPSDVYTLIVWLATDETNQVYQAQNSGSAPVGQVVDLTVSLAVDPCAKYQRDVYIGLPKQDRYTLSDVRNYFLAAPGVFWGPSQWCRTQATTTTTTVPPTLKPCSVSSFVSWTHAPRAEVEATGIETETVIVKDGQGPVVWYLSSWAAWGTFEFGVPLPQTRIHMTVQTLHDGVNTIQVQIATSAESLIWQIEGGCEPGPPILTSAQDREHGGQFDWLDDDGDDLVKRVVTFVFRSERKGNR